MRLLMDRQAFRDYLWLASLGAVGLCIFAAMISGFRLSAGSATQLASIVIVMINELADVCTEIIVWEFFDKVKITKFSV